jgi:pyruvate-formate lyase
MVREAIQWLYLLVATGKVEGQDGATGLLRARTFMLR